MTMENKIQQWAIYTVQGSDMVTYIKINRLKWAGRVICMEEQSATRRVLVAAVKGRRQRGRQKLRWEEVWRKMPGSWGREIGRNAARNRDSWQKLLKKALVQKGLLCQWWWWWWWWTLHMITNHKRTAIKLSNFTKPAKFVLFRRVRKITKSFVMRVRLSVHPHGRARFTLVGLHEI